MSRNVRFRPDRKRIISRPFMVGAFVTALVLILVISSFVILKENNFNFRAAIGGEVSEDEDEEEETTITSDEKRYYLLWCKDSSDSQLQFLWVMGVSLPEGKYEVYSPSVGSSVEYNGRYSTLSEIFNTDGPDGLLSACEGLCEVDISGYIGSDTENFKQMINKLGSVTVNVPQQIDYKGEYNLILSSGKNTLKGDQLYKYLCYTGYVSYGASTMRTDVMREILENSISPDDLSKVETLYSNIANLLITDITRVDYTASADFINQLFTSGVVSVTEVTEPTGFSKD